MEEARRFLSGPGELGRRMANHDWSGTPLGHLDRWPQSLKTSISLILNSQQPMWIGWGREMTFLYNDAYIPVLSLAKHPWALGRPAAEVWAEIWDFCGPLAEKVFRDGQATVVDDVRLFMNRGDYLEETYFSFSYSPIRDESGNVGGLFCPNTEGTPKVLNARRLRTLSELTAKSLVARSTDAACASVASTLARNLDDVPFSVLYLSDPGGTRAMLQQSTGLGLGSPLLADRAPALDESLSPAGHAPDDKPLVWPVAEVARSGCSQEVPLTSVSGLPRGPADQRITQAVVLPLIAPGVDHPVGVLVAGVNPTRKLDPEYRTFFTLLAGQAASAIQNARVAEQEKDRADKLAELDRAKTAFFSNISHEFRTPLTLMLGPLEDALTSLPEAVWPAVGPHLQTAHRNALRLLKLVNALLDFSRIEAGRVQARFQPTDLAVLTTELAGVFRSALQRVGLHLTVECEPLPEPVHVDREMWEKIVLNLLSNAFKFTFEGGVWVTMKVVGPAVQLVVRDSGVGVAREELPRLFERFYRAEGARARTHEGSGIGLALVQELVRMHGGEIRAESEPGVGTSFTIEIPRGTAHLPRPLAGDDRPASSVRVDAQAFVDEALRWLPGDDQVAADRAGVTLPATGTAADGGRILVADDNADMRDYLARLLAGRFAVEAVTDGHAALAAIQRTPFDLVISDVMMPGLDGFGLLRGLREDPRLRELPVILLSARAGEEARVEGLRAGADDYLVKPFSARELLARVSSQLALKRLREASAQERALLLERERVARAEAEAANRTKDDFLAMLGHELRNPLAPIATAVQLMRIRGQAPRELGVIERQVGHLLRLVEDLLDVSRIARGRIQLRKARIELATVVARGVELASPMLEQRQQRLDVEVPAHGLVLDADPDRLAQVLSNLLTNASKYSEPGTRITIIAARTSAERQTVRLTVRDQGMGIPAPMIGQIFDMFVQQPQALDRSKGGLGLGLAIVRSLVGLHGGEVSAYSEGVGRGSQFVVELPLVEGVDHLTPAPAMTAPLPLPPVAARGLRVLVVDDNQDAAETIADVLGTLGYHVRMAHDGPGALAIAQQWKPEVCLLDIGLPAMDGYELARRLRALPGIPADLQLVAITGYGQEEDRRRSHQAGFSLHLVKPVSVDLLVHQVNQLVDRPPASS